MLNDLEKNIIYFDNDEEFGSFCIKPTPVITTIVCDGDECKFIGSDFSDAYKNALANDTRFCIRDINSHVNKDGYLEYMNCTKKIDNVEQYYGAEF